MIPAFLLSFNFFSPLFSTVFSGFRMVGRGHIATSVSDALKPRGGIARSVAAASCQIIAVAPAYRQVSTERIGARASFCLNDSGLAWAFFCLGAAASAEIYSRLHKH